MIQLSQRAKNLKPSPTLALAAKARELQDRGEDVISLTVGEPDWPTYDFVIEAGIEALYQGHTRYVPANGIPELRKVIADAFSKETGLTVDFKSQVTVSAGAKFVLFSAMQSLIDSGDEVICPSPYWVSYPAMVELAEGVPVIAHCSKADQFKLTPEILESKISAKTKLLILNSPSNPTGMVYSEPELKALSEVLVTYPKITILSDDIYNRLYFSQKVAPHILKVAPQLADRVLCVNGVSKTYAMTGWRLGWGIGPSHIIKAMSDYQSQSVSCAPSFAQRAAITAILGGDNRVTESVRVLKGRINKAVDCAQKIAGLEPFAPQGAFYLWLGIERLLGKNHNGKLLRNSSDFAMELIESEKVVTVPGLDFGQDGYLRLSVALPDQQIVEAFSRIARFVSELT
ncbi:MAG: pyridoxal phosphate-dependent aminotransferase [Bdellovibrionales bacterium CG10_big_fil_rev_8_21_14_0_10_45_34]|nr:MAG: pyridoxal phosphate-dependent aminotransferase [Bdellovibrionales bacterium CG10_big_fil_rev_8_21_14_0_10_45_34]